MKLKFIIILSIYLSLSLTSMYTQTLDFPTEAGDEIEAPIDGELPIGILVFVGTVLGIKLAIKKAKDFVS